MRTLSMAVVILVAVLVAVPVHAEQHASAPGPKHPPSVRTESADATSLSGKVTETVDAGGYTYVCLEKNGVMTWVAMPQTKVAVGQTLSVQPGQVMMNFQSKSLNRTFDSIVFSAGLAPASGAPAAPPQTAPHGHAGSKARVAEKVPSLKVEKAGGKNGYTVSDVYTKRDALDKKTVAVRGKVVKVSPAIMQQNWIHLQDGTGDQKKGTHDLVVTTQDLPEVGEIVTATGTLGKDKDFGAGYVYQVILESAKISK
jgi:hypothetical protein